MLTLIMMMITMMIMIVAIMMTMIIMIMMMIMIITITITIIIIMMMMIVMVVTRIPYNKLVRWPRIDPVQRYPIIATVLLCRPNSSVPKYTSSSKSEVRY